jgi:hypothetical protein
LHISQRILKLYNADFVVHFCIAVLHHITLKIHCTSFLDFAVHSIKKSACTETNYITLSVVTLSKEPRQVQLAVIFASNGYIFFLNNVKTAEKRVQEVSYRMKSI